MSRDPKSDARGEARSRAASPFHDALRARAKAYFEDAGLAPSAPARAYAKGAVYVGALAGIHAVYLAWSPLPAPALLALAVGAGLVVAGIIFNVHHDGGHGAWSDRAWVNRVMAASFDLVGMSSYLWRWKHNRLHHTHPNVEGLDDDLEIAPFGRMAPGQAWRPHHRFQHVYLWFLYPFHTLKWILLDDFRELALGRIGRHPIRRPRGADLALLLGGKLGFFVWMLWLPAAIHGPAVALGYFVVCQLTVGLSTALVFQLAHVVEEAERSGAEAAGEARRIDWAAHQVRATVDFSRGSRFASVCLGGMNHQVVHHLFPGVSHVHYPSLSHVVEDVCRTHGVPYRIADSAWELLRSHHRWLRRMGEPPALTGAASPAAAGQPGRAA